MSKAFTREDDVELPPEVPRPSGPIWLTPEGHALLVAREAALRAEGAVVAAATLALRLEVARLVPSRAVGDTGPLRLGDLVMVRGAQGERTLRLVGPDEVDLVFPVGEPVSVLSPLGRALVGAEVGDEVDVEYPDRDEVLEVVALLA